MPESNDGVIAEFQRRRKRMLYSFGSAMMLFALGLVLMQIVDLLPGFLGIGRFGWKAAAIAQLTAGMIFALLGFSQYRCPVCETIIKGDDKYYLGVTLDPGTCPKCSARLRE
jgi:hypothetical protein